MVVAHSYDYLLSALARVLGMRFIGHMHCVLSVNLALRILAASIMTCSEPPLLLPLLATHHYYPQQS